MSPIVAVHRDHSARPDSDELACADAVKSSAPAAVDTADALEEHVPAPVGDTWAQVGRDGEVEARRLPGEGDEAHLALKGLNPDVVGIRPGEQGAVAVQRRRHPGYRPVVGYDVASPGDGCVDQQPPPGRD